jgi:hypothetical protein
MITGLQETQNNTAPLHHILAACAFCAVCVCKLAAWLEHVGALISCSLADSALDTLSVGEQGARALLPVSWWTLSARLA